MKKIVSFFSAAVVGGLFILILSTSAVAAVSADYYPPENWGDTGINWVIWPQTCSGDAVEFTLRVGDQTLDGDFELNHMVGGVYQEAGGQYTWGNGVDVDFIMTHDAATGDVTLSLAGGPSTTWHSGRPGEALQNIFLYARTQSNNPDYRMEVKNLNLNGAPISVTLISVDKQKPSMRIYGEPFSDFILQGTVNFYWGADPPNNGSMIETRVSMTFAADDMDGDGFGNVCDNCPAAVNPDLADIDSDNVGDVCDSCPTDPTNDVDNDGICGLSDNCPSVSNVGQEDCNANGTGDACDAVNPGATEVCDAIDNNCNGSTDENLTQATTCGVGACAGNTGTETCTAGVWGGDTCDPLAGATPETCNNVDDNCDGTVDENLTQVTTCGVGACAGNVGEKSCTAGVWGGDTCDPLAGAVAETCNNVDDNCDGSVDENLNQEISCELPGACVNDTGVLSCIAGVWDNTCDSLPSATPEECDDIDNDCDGITDEGVTVVFYQDSDGDAFGTVETTENACTAPPGFTTNSGDCDDSVNTIYPGAEEICGDQIDQDCDGSDAQCMSLVLLEDVQGQQQEFHDAIQPAYDVIPSGGVKKISTQAIDYPESLFFDKYVIVTLTGGYDALFEGSPIGMTTITADSGLPAITISNGTVIIANFFLR